jgi:hypothetical protein
VNRGTTPSGAEFTAESAEPAEGSSENK